jgi:hypothetical protein
MTQLTDGLATICVELGDTTFTRDGAKRDENVGLRAVLETASVLPRRSSGYDWFVTRCGEIESAEKYNILCPVHFDINNVLLPLFI